ncbi:hypothetical protein IC620_10220 [Hazenella sp. IB182357]|uniref:Uncharacterized protein n=1 Tax=Polycladospora coralii TaxID=2771432 RepID=A0A926N6S5_9BACL|nr:hypothetical protein [Polycladospora coralii]MBD1372731.1 hypothetical protein [Polycladospora coralii]MBS7531122.1 hypothetical protein [Polycladospora coralii]
MVQNFHIRDVFMKDQVKEVSQNTSPVPAMNDQFLDAVAEVLEAHKPVLENLKDQ